MMRLRCGERPPQRLACPTASSDTTAPRLADRVEQSACAALGSRRPRRSRVPPPCGRRPPPAPRGAPPGRSRYAAPETIVTPRAAAQPAKQVRAGQSVRCGLPGADDAEPVDERGGVAGDVERRAVAAAPVARHAGYPRLRESKLASAARPSTSHLPRTGSRRPRPDGPRRHGRRAFEVGDRACDAEQPRDAPARQVAGARGACAEPVERRRRARSLEKGMSDEVGVGQRPPALRSRPRIAHAIADRLGCLGRAVRRPADVSGSTRSTRTPMSSRSMQRSADARLVAAR